MIDLLLTDGFVVTMDKQRRLLQNGGVAINKGRIIDVGNSEDLNKKYQAKKVIDCKGHVIMPGFIDAHGHGGHSLFKTIASDNIGDWMPIITTAYKHFVTDEFWYYEGKLSALERLKCGVTTGVSVMGSVPRSDNPIFSINHAKAYTEIGVREIVCTGPANPPWPQSFSRWKDGKRIVEEVTFDQAIKGAEAVIEALNHSHNDHIRAFITPYVIVTSVNSSAPTPLESLHRLTDHDKMQARLVRSIAKKYDTRIHSDAFGGMIHLAAKEKEFSLFGPDVHLQHCRGISFDEVKILAETGTNVSASPGFGSINARTPVTELIEMGTTVAITTDGTSPISPFDMFQAMRRMQLLQQAALRDYYYLPPGKLLEMVTIDAAKCVGWDDEIGSLEIGKKADVITVNFNQPHLTPAFMHVHRLVYQAVGSDVDTVIVDGNVVMENRIVNTVDEKQVLDEANEEAWATVKRAGLEPFMQPTSYFWGHARAYLDERRFNKEEFEQKMEVKIL
ncbi:amidohydrolase family protein [Bacillus sp. JJ1773]|uniref:amidohydrolase family protein n=1 Tax=Bacillus sp. JJ1773 TaxID=3122965 RepID=UPI002FFD9646